MERFQKIVWHEKYKETYERLQQLEIDRKFCGHDIEHFLSVARISYLMILEKRLPVSKDIIYAIYPDVVKEIEKDKLNYKFIKKHGTCSTLHFYAKVAWFYRKKITVSKLAFYLRKKANLAVKRGFN